MIKLKISSIPPYILEPFLEKIQYIIKFNSKFDYEYSQYRLLNTFYISQYRNKIEIGNFSEGSPASSFPETDLYTIYKTIKDFSK